MAERKKATRTKKREKKNVPTGHAHIQSTFNNTIVTITDMTGNVVSWGSAGLVGFKGSRKSTPYAAAQTAEGAAKRGTSRRIRSLSERASARCAAHAGHADHDQPDEHDDAGAAGGWSCRHGHPRRHADPA